MRTIVGHIAGWALVSAFFMIPLIVFGFTNKVQHAICSFGLYVVVFYINVFVVIPAWIKKRNLWKLLAGWLGLIILCTTISILFNHLFNVYTRNGNLQLEVINTTFRNVLFVGMVLLAGIAFRSITDWFHNEKVKHRLENENLKTELSFLKSQVNPHFLFNTLNNIYALAYRKSENTAEAVMRLSELLHYMLYDSKAERVPVAREIHYIEQLIALQQLRAQDPLELRLSVTGDVERHSMAPLLLIPIVENIFKHGILKEYPASIDIHIDQGKLFFQSKNKMATGVKDQAGGIGMINVQRRLALLYPYKHEFTITNDRLFYSVNLILELL